jgi:hypothetical protein
MATLSNWSPYGEYVQGGMVDGRFMNAAYTMIAAGPPRLANMGGASLAGAALASGSGNAATDQLAYPIGVVQNFSLSHNMTVSRFFELGSVRSYFIPGRVMGQANLGRIMYHGPSLLRVLYAYYQDGVAPTKVETMLGGISASTMPNPHDVKIPPGYENVYLNLASDLFTQPIGLLLMLKDNNEDTMAAVYLESCYIPSHSISTDAMGTIIQENVSIQFERAVPIATQVVGLITSD